MENYDAIIVGSGLGGLQCGFILSLEGYKVLILEKNKQIGGNLQTFSRDKCIFDTGVHYIGGLSKGQNLYRYFKYFKLMDKLKLQKLDEDGFDILTFDGDENKYPYAQGYDNFIEQLVKFFPNERAALENYCSKIKEICNQFPLYNLEESDKNVMESGVLDISAKAFIESLTSDFKLQQILAGTNALYAGIADKTPLYVHALVINSYIESSYRCVDGGSQIARILAHHIFANGGKILKHKEVNKFVIENDICVAVETKDGERFEGKNFISNMPPAVTLDMLDTTKIKKAYRDRINGLENTTSVFTLHIVLKKDANIPYFNHNYYHLKSGSVWSALDYKPEEWPLGYCVFTSAHSKPEPYCESLNIMTYMNYNDVKKWKNTFNTVGREDFRGEEYEAFKIEKAEKILDELESFFPGIRDKTHAYYTSTPLSFRDYIGSRDGSLYGIVKDFNDPIKTFISPKTKISNLLLTGQNLNMHGILGVTISAVNTCGVLLGSSYLLDKIKRASE